jgi:hypothetical protein
MPIADPFAPVVAAATGTENLGWDTIDFGDGTWTFHNPNTTFAGGYSATTDGAGNSSFEWSSMTAATAAEMPTNSTSIDCPRAYKQLFKPDGSPYTIADLEQNITLFVGISDVSVPAPNTPAAIAILGLTAGTTTNVQSAVRDTYGMNGTGFFFTNNTNTFPQFVCYTTTGQNTQANSGQVRAQGSFPINGRYGGTSVLQTFTATGQNVVRTSRNSNKNYGANGNLYLTCVWGAYAFGTDLSSFTGANALKAKLHYKLVSFETQA